MLRTYEAILSGDRVDWTDEAPDAERPVRVHVTIVEDAETAPERGERMADALARLAEAPAFVDVEDPATWQRQVREDRPLPARSE